MTPLQYRPRYLQRLGLVTPPPPTLDTLRELQARHTAEFPFETLSTFLREPVDLALPTLERKLLFEGRGGYCFELNGLFQQLLISLGFDVTGLAARVVMGQDQGAMAARTHMVLRVRVEGVDHLVDVGFGGMVPTAPLRLDTEEAQTTPHEPYRLQRRGGDFLLSAQVGDEWRPLYRFDLQPQAHIDYVLGNWYVSTHPDSSFIGQLRVARTGPGWRKTFNNGSFAVHTMGGATVRRELADADEVMQVLTEEFGLRLPADPRLRERLAALPMLAGTVA